MVAGFEGLLCFLVFLFVCRGFGWGWLEGSGLMEGQLVGGLGISMGRNYGVFLTNQESPHFFYSLYNSNI